MFNTEIKPHVKIESVPSTYLWGFEGSQVITHDRRGQARTFAAVRGFPLTGELWSPGLQDASPLISPAATLLCGKASAHGARRSPPSDWLMIL